MTDKSKDDERSELQSFEHKLNGESVANCQSVNTFYETHRFEAEIYGIVKKESFLSQGSEIVEFRSDNEEAFVGMELGKRQVKETEENMIFYSNKMIPSCCVSLATDSCDIF